MARNKAKHLAENMAENMSKDGASKLFTVQICLFGGKIKPF